MRLDVLDHGHGRRARLFLGMVAGISRTDMADVVKALLYRPKFVGRPLLALTAEAMRGRSSWTPAEREYIALSTAQWHQCSYCAQTHIEMTRLASHSTLTADDLATGHPRLDAVLDLLKVNFAWNITNRMAHAFGYQLRDGQLVSGTKALHLFRYRMPSFLLGPARSSAKATRDR